MNFSGFFGIKNQIFKLKSLFSIFISAQVTWCNLERPIKSRSMIKAGGDVATSGASNRASNHDRRSSRGAF